MDITLTLQAAFLGLIEGLTEFLPISSTGHLIITGWLLGFDSIPGRVFEIVIQLGAICAVVLRYRTKIWRIGVTLPRSRESQRFVMNICIAFLPAAIVGVLAHGYIKAHLFFPNVVAISLILGGIAMIMIENMKLKPTCDSLDDFSPRLALMIGIAQCVAVIPGVSRSGATIMGALLAGADRKAAAEFSFFLAIPTLLGATVYDLYKNWAVLSFDNMALIAVGFITAFISALLVVEWLIRFVSTHGYKPFAYYRIALGIVILATLA